MRMQPDDNAMTQPFDLEKAKAGAKVVTRDGRQARCIFFNAKGKYPIVVLYMEPEGYEMVYLVNASGEFWVHGVHVENNDLVMADTNNGGNDGQV